MAKQFQSVAKLSTCCCQADAKLSAVTYVAIAKSSLNHLHQPGSDQSNMNSLSESVHYFLVTRPIPELVLSLPDRRLNKRGGSSRHRKSSWRNRGSPVPVNISTIINYQLSLSSSSCCRPNSPSTIIVRYSKFHNYFINVKKNT